MGSGEILAVNNLVQKEFKIVRQNRQPYICTPSTLRLKLLSIFSFHLKAIFFPRFCFLMPFYYICFCFTWTNSTYSQYVFKDVFKDYETTPLTFFLTVTLNVSIDIDIHITSPYIFIFTRGSSFLQILYYFVQPILNICTYVNLTFRRRKIFIFKFCNQGSSFKGIL